MKSLQTVVNPSTFHQPAYTAKNLQRWALQDPLENKNKRWKI